MKTEPRSSSRAVNDLAAQVVLLCLTLAMILFKLSTKFNPDFHTFIFSTCVLLYIFKIILVIKIMLSGHSCALSAIG